MKVLRIKDNKRRGLGHFTIWVWARDDAIHWKECPFSFHHESNKVYFLFGGQESGKRLVGEVQNKDDAIKKATIYLEAWLRECRAID